MQAESLAIEQTGTLRQLRIALVSETYPPEINGVAMTTSRFAEGLQKLGHKVLLVCPKQTKPIQPPAGEPAAITVKGLPIPFYQGLQIGLPAKKTLLQAWRRFAPDIVHIVTEGPLGASALTAAKTLGIPAVSGFHTNFHQYSQHYGFGFLKGGVIAYLRRFHNRCHATFVPTVQMAETLERLAIHNARILARGIDCKLFSPVYRDTALRRSLGTADERCIVLYVGRIAAEKNLLTVVAAFRAIQEVLPDARMVFVGEGPLLTKLRNQNPDFIFPGARTGAGLAAYFASADMFLFASLTETFGNVVLEAMASGLAVIAYDYAAARQHIRRYLALNRRL